MKNWKSVSAVLAGTAAVIGVSLFGATSAGTQPYKSDYMASWMQAIGSIAAIAGAYWVAERQGRQQRLHALEMDRLARQRSYEAFRAIMENGYKRARDLTCTATGLKKDAFVDYWKRAERQFMDTINALSMVPLYSLGSYEAVDSLIGMKDTLANMKEAVEAYISPFFASEPLDEAGCRAKMTLLMNNAEHFLRLFSSVASRTD
ncbi:hypothetical protein ISG18_26735 [Burkholderia pseudomallei]|uniref:hypothetical protein n=1 Tax=Burkholderia pseudomallei TaxID=28450 RepID=UPI000F1375F1|nr:hypothetical protein [Burkholderia pseudomallei]MBF3782282.1 hypothetical protein [Burkholderia pseudomallei]VBI72855.1 Uncharacterised protein [Burkholderia pseudomallei]